MVYWVKGHTRHAVLPLWPCRNFLNSSAHLLSGWWQSDGIPVKKLQDGDYFLRASMQLVIILKNGLTGPPLIYSSPRPSLLFCSGFLGATAPHALTSSAAPNAVLNSLNSSMSPLQTPTPSNPTPSPSLWPSSLTSTQGILIRLLMCVFLKRKRNSFYMERACADTPSNV